MMDLEECERRIASLKLLGSKGTTGTQASFVELFDGDGEKIKALEADIAEQMGVEAVVPVSGQTYSPRLTAWWSMFLSGITLEYGGNLPGQSAHPCLPRMERPFADTSD